MMKLLEPVYKWQRWPRCYDPTDADLEAMSDEEYDYYWEEQCRWEHTQGLRTAGRSPWKVLWRGRSITPSDLVDEDDYCL